VLYSLIAILAFSYSFRHQFALPTAGLACAVTAGAEILHRTIEATSTLKRLRQINLEEIDGGKINSKRGENVNFHEINRRNVNSQC